MSEPASAPPERTSRARLPLRVRWSFWRIVLLPLQLLWAMLLVQSLIGSLVVVGWTYRLIRRSVIKRWWAQSGRQSGETFVDFLSARPDLKSHSRWPNWIVEQDFSSSWKEVDDSGRWPGGRLLKSLFHSLGLNLKLGLQAVANTWVLTLPACALWLFGWHAGWINSFTKGYESASVGPLIGWSGVLLFIVVMMYLPMAQIRQAVTGEWRSFYQFTLIST